LPIEAAEEEAAYLAIEGGEAANETTARQEEKRRRNQSKPMKAAMQAKRKVKTSEISVISHVIRHGKKQLKKRRNASASYWQMS